jgi:nicotinate dehydrogenase subunit B
MAHYLASFQAPVTQAEAQGQADRLVRAASAPGPAGEGAQLYEGACAACHEAGTGFMFGVRPLLAVNTNLQSSRPDNLLRIILDGAGGHGQRSGAMPPFRDSLDDRQLSSLLTYLRARFGGGKPEWSGIERAAARSRAEPAFR